MYATAVGLVLSGFRSLDEREERYKEAKENQNQKTVKVKKEKQNLASDFFSNILNKTKGLLIDDLSDKNEY
jgi:cell division protein FtsA